MKHTKGPWINLGNGDIVARSEDFCGGEKDIASVFLTSNDEDEANAHLIAAAPDLLEALDHIEKTITRQLELIADRAPGDYLDKRPVVQSLQSHARRARAAIAKAGGAA